MAFGEYFPNPGMFDSATFSVSPLHAFAVEAFGTAILAFVIFALTERRNAGIPTNGMVPFFIGFTVAAPDQFVRADNAGGMEPSRGISDRGSFRGSRAGEISLSQDQKAGFWVYILGPLVGAPLGALLFKLVIEPGFPGGKPEPVQIARSKYE